MAFPNARRVLNGGVSLSKLNRIVFGASCEHRIPISIVNQIVETVTLL